MLELVPLLAGGARLVVRLTCNQKAAGSSPATSSKKNEKKVVRILDFLVTFVIFIIKEVRK